MQEDGFPSLRSNMSNVCTLCSGPIEAPDTHEICIRCLCLAHAEAALTILGLGPSVISLVRIFTRAVSDLGLEWELPDKQAKSKLDSWFLYSGGRAAAPRK